MEEKRGGLQPFEHAAAAVAAFFPPHSPIISRCVCIFLWFRALVVDVSSGLNATAFREGGRKVMAACKALSECGDKDSPPDGRPFTSDPSTVPQTGLHTGATRMHSPRFLDTWAGILPQSAPHGRIFIVVVVDVNWRHGEIIALK